MAPYRTTHWTSPPTHRAHLTHSPPSWTWAREFLQTILDLASRSSTQPCWYLHSPRPVPRRASGSGGKVTCVVLVVLLAATVSSDGFPSIFPSSRGDCGCSVSKTSRSPYYRVCVVWRKKSGWVVVGVLTCWGQSAASNLKNGLLSIHRSFPPLLLIWFIAQASWINLRFVSLSLSFLWLLYHEEKLRKKMIVLSWTSSTTDAKALPHRWCSLVVRGNAC
jgi:hypothetical protein